jgi:hypothetical protein
MHDVAVGPLKHCQITGSTNLFEAIDLGHQPPCDALLDSLDVPEKTYPLRLMICPESGLAQLDYVVDGSEIYPPTYPYRSGITKPLADYQKAFADGVVARFGKGFVVDVGSNDGTLLTGFWRNGCHVMGVEPTNVAKIAWDENGVETIQRFFDEETAKLLIGIGGRAHIVTMTNVFAHMAPLGSVMHGIQRLLDGDGVFITESHYLLDVLKGNQYDTIYHEHIRTYSLKSIKLLVEQYGMEVFDVQRADRYGGNIRAYIGWKGKRPICPAVAELLALEDAEGLHDIESWKAFRTRVLNERDALMMFLYQCRSEGKRVAGVSAPGRCATLLNFCGIGPDLIEYLGELPNSLKLGKYQPGTHIPIVSNERIPKEQPDVLILMAWHYSKPIVERLRREGVTASIYAPLPTFRCVSESFGVGYSLCA